MYPTNEDKIIMALAVSTGISVLNMYMIYEVKWDSQGWNQRRRSRRRRRRRQRRICKLPVDWRCPKINSGQRQCTINGWQT
jgi:hypothetical protein